MQAWKSFEALRVAIGCGICLTSKEESPHWTGPAVDKSEALRSLRRHRRLQFRTLACLLLGD
jgi:hypothetical protein